MPGIILDPLAGCIKWLPPKEELKPGDVGIDEGCCNHPVVVLSTRTHNSRVEILVITSLKGSNLETRFPTQKQLRLNHLPIAPSKKHPDNDILLSLKDASRPLRKKSYINTRDRHTVHLASLRSYNRRGPEIFLSKKSYQVLTTYILFAEAPEEPEPYSLAAGNIPRISSDVGLGSSIGDQRSAAAEDVAFLLNYHRRSIEDNRTRRPPPSHYPPVTHTPPVTHIPRVTHVPRVTVARAERQPLIPPREEYGYRPRVYGSHTLLPTSYPIHSGYTSDPAEPSNWKKLWKCVKIILWICLTLGISLGISYGLYRGGRWVVAACGRAIDWAKGRFGSLGEYATSSWGSFLQKLELGDVLY
ncbi:hypothetical protein ANO14919_134130 [Xylariales sp. No.14919]|nr:hypothetical protein ANO14919_134130 [Xylariales sp. No.14919]